MNEIEENKFKYQNWIWIAVLVIIVALGAYYFGSQKNSNPNVTPSTSYQPTATDASTQTQGGVYDYTQAANHIGENAQVRGMVVKVDSSKKGTIFLDYCSNYRTCPFSAVVFSSNSGNFTNLSSYEGHYLTISGQIKTYQGRAEIILNNPSQIIKVE